MTKTLTEQWREGTLRGCFYWKLPNGNICTAYTDTMRDMKNVRDSNEVEVLEEAPSYYEYQDIIQQNVNQEAAIETYIEDIKRLQEQINEANEIIKECCKRIEFRQVCLASFPPQFKIYDCLYNEIEDYFKKYDINWGVK